MTIVVFNFDLSLSSAVSDGRQVTWAADLNTGAATAFFFAEHSMNTGNTVLLICGEQIGLTGTDMLATNVDMDVFAQTSTLAVLATWSKGLRSPR